MIGTMPVCQVCRHLDTMEDNPYGLTCPAFPDGIPDDILDAMDDHTSVVGRAQVAQVVFEVVPGMEAVARDIQAGITARKAV